MSDIDPMPKACEQIELHWKGHCETPAHVYKAAARKRAWMPASLMTPHWASAVRVVVR